MPFMRRQIGRKSDRPLPVVAVFQCQSWRPQWFGLCEQPTGIPVVRPVHFEESHRPKAVAAASQSAELVMCA